MIRSDDNNLLDTLKSTPKWQDHKKSTTTVVVVGLYDPTIKHFFSLPLTKNLFERHTEAEKPATVRPTHKYQQSAANQTKPNRTERAFSFVFYFVFRFYFYFYFIFEIEKMTELRSLSFSVPLSLCVYICAHETCTEKYM